MDAKKIVPVVATLIAGAVAVHYVTSKRRAENNEETNELPQGHKDLEGLETIASSPEQHNSQNSLPAATTAMAEAAK